MSQQNKTYADKSNDWKELIEENFLWNLFYPRWWNPLFWILVFITPLVRAFHYTFHKIDEDGFISSFFYGLSESAKDVCNFFQMYKVW